MIRTDHLCLSSGVVTLSRLDDAELLDEDIELYRFTDGPEWPSELGETPDWLQAEHDELEREIEDQRSFALDCDWTARNSYAMAKGR